MSWNWDWAKVVDDPKNFEGESKGWLSNLDWDWSCLSGDSCFAIGELRSCCLCLSANACLRFFSSSSFRRFSSKAFYFPSLIGLLLKNKDFVIFLVRFFERN